MDVTQEIPTRLTAIPAYSRWSRPRSEEWEREHGGVSDPELLPEMPPLTDVSFLFLMQVGLVLGFLAGYPAVRLLVQRGVKTA